MARPSLYTEELATSILDQMSEGIPLAEVCRQDGMPDRRTIGNWRKARPDFDERYQVARRECFDVIAEDTLEIADDSRNDWMERAAEGGDEKARQFNGEHVQRAKLRIDTRFRLLEKLDPARYGNKVQHANAEGGMLPPAPQFIVQPVMPAAVAADAAEPDSTPE